MMNLLRMILLKGYHARVAEIERKSTARFIRGNVTAQAGRMQTKTGLKTLSEQADLAMRRLLAEG